MLKFQISYEVLEFDAEGFMQELRRAIVKQLIHAAREFVRSAVPRVPVWSGMARGSFLHLGRLVGASVPISPKETGKTYFHRGVRLPKTPESGARLATAPDRALRQEGQDTFIFEFFTDVFHYNLNEIFGSVSRTSPWLSFRHGHNAMLLDFQKSRELKQTFPKFKNFVTRRQITK